MIRGTTPVLNFNLAMETSLIKSAEIVLQYVDNSRTVNIERTLEDCIVSENSIAAVLTQEETLGTPMENMLK